MLRVSLAIFFKPFWSWPALAGLDYVFQRWSYEKSLRMTRREVQDEFKQTEGDPLIKSRIRSIQRELARRRMMAEVPKADVIITNPTHLAVALQYRIQGYERAQGGCQRGGVWWPKDQGNRQGPRDSPGGKQALGPGAV